MTPTFQQIIISEWPNRTIYELLQKSNVGITPIYFDLLALSSDESANFVRELENCIFDLKIDPLIPYPIYLISKDLHISITIPVIERTELLPKFFFQKSRPLKGQEVGIFNKLQILKLKGQNFIANKGLEVLHSAKLEQKKLYNLCKEKSFLSSLQEDLRRLGSK